MNRGSPFHRKPGRPSHALLAWEQVTLARDLVGEVCARGALLAKLSEVYDQLGVATVALERAEHSLIRRLGHGKAASDEIEAH